MMNCLKCQKEYIPKRIGGLFCGDSCGNAYRQKKKRDELKKARLVEQGLAVKNPLTEDEQFLWSILSKLGATAIVLDDEAKLPGDKRPADFGIRLGEFIRHTKAEAQGVRMQEIGARLGAQLEAKKRTDEALKTKQEKRTAQSNTK